MENRMGKIEYKKRDTGHRHRRNLVGKRKRREKSSEIREKQLGSLNTFQNTKAI